MAFRFHLQGKTLVLIDWANVFNWLRGQNWEIDPERLFKYLRRYKNVDRICIFAGEDDHPKSREFLEECRKIGYQVIFKKVKYVPVEVEKSPFWDQLNEYVPEKQIEQLKKEPLLRRKCDFDVEISKELLLHLDEYHTYILFSGDGDYAPVIEEVMKRQKRIFIVSSTRALGRELREMMDRKVHPILVDIFSLKDVAQKRFRGRRRTPKKEEGLLSKIFSGFFGK